jgi:linoleoyl-CoA desaturase
MTGLEIFHSNASEIKGAKVSRKLEPLAELKEQIVAHGWNHKATGRVVSELLANLTNALAGIWAFVVFDGLLARTCAILVSTAGSMGVATNTHTSSHYATSRTRWVNELLTFFGYPLFVGMSACYWWQKHVVVHHPAPNVVGVDGDVDLLPWFARTKQEVVRTSGGRRIYHEKIQGLVFPFAIAFVGFNMQVAGWRFLIMGLRRAGGGRKKEWIDLGSMVLHFVIWLGIPMVFFAPLEVLGFYCLRTGLMGYAVFAVLAPGHFPAEAACLSGREKNCDYVLLQTAATVNFRTGWLGRLVCSGLEYQIEHHLFPNLSHVHYPKLAVLVREFCTTHGFPYRCYSWPLALWKSLQTIQTPPPELTELYRLESTAESIVGRSGVVEKLG